MQAFRVLSRLVVVIAAGAILGACGAETGSPSPSPLAARPGIQMDTSWQADAGTWTFTGRVDPQGAATDVVLEIGPGPSTLRQFDRRVDVVAGAVDPGPLSISTRDLPDIPEICVRFTATNSAGTSSSTPLCVPHDRPTFVPDQNPPVVRFNAPPFGSLTIVASTSYEVAWTETDAGSGVSSRSLQRQAAPATPHGCGPFADDGDAALDPSPVAVTGLVDGMCYQWVLTLRDLAGDAGVTVSGAIRVDIGSPN